MKRYFLLAVLLVASITSCKKAEAKAEQAASEQTEEVVVDPNAKYGEMTFEQTEHNFGDISQGEVVSHVFKFKNTGEIPLIITGAKGSCGCTVPTFPKEPIAPGEGGEIPVSFSSKGRSGNQLKTVSIDANTKKGTETVTIQSNVVTQ